MVKLIVLYGPPSDPEAFDAHYFGTHVPLAEKIPGVKGFSVSKLGAIDSSASPYYLLAELSFDSSESMQAALATAEGQAAAGDIANFATGGVTMLVADVVAGE